MKSLAIDLKLNRPQLEAFAACQPGNTVFTGWGRGVGKSWFHRTLWWLSVAQYDFKVRTEALDPFRGVRITSLAPTLKQWKDIHWEGIEEELSSRGRFGFLGAKLDRQSGQVRFPGGSILRPFPATAYNARTARGMRTDILDADEFDDIDADVYDSIAVPWLSEPWSLQIELLGGTPTRGRHGLWWRTLRAGQLGAKLRSGIPIRELLSQEQIDLFRVDDSSDDDVAAALSRSYAFHATYRDAPETVSLRQVAKAKANTTEATFKREWEADPDAGEGLVYPFDEKFHVIGAENCPHAKAPDVFQEFHVGMDHGWVDPGVLILGGITGHGEDATLWLLDEEYESEVANPEWDKRAKKWKSIAKREKNPRTGIWDKTGESHRVKFWPDPSRPDRINDLKAAGIHVGEVDNEIFGGIGRVAEFMFIRTSESGQRWARMYVSRKCRNVIRELGLYRRKKMSDGTFDEQPEDKNNHACDALRYMVVGRFGLRRKDIYGAQIKPILL